jgi:hypothetical protein
MLQPEHRPVDVDFGQQWPAGQLSLRALEEPVLDHGRTGQEANPSDNLARPEANVNRNANKKPRRSPR